MRKLTILIPSLALLMLLAVAVAPAFASPQNNLVIDVTYTIINQDDQGVCSWYWALDNRVVHLQVWQLPDGTYLAKESSIGSFYVPKGANTIIKYSPDFSGQVRSGFGVLTSCDTWIVHHGTLNPTTFADGSPLKTQGYLGTVNYGGKVADILKGVGFLGGNPGYWSWAMRDQNVWVSPYFSGDLWVENTKSVWIYRLLFDPSAVARYCETTYSKSPITGDIIT